MKVAVLFDRFGPYHVARLDAAAKWVSLVPIELFGESSEYQWEKVDGLANRVTLFQNRSNNTISSTCLFRAMQKELHKQAPDAVAINGWSDRGALSALYWCQENRVPAIVMSDSTATDEKRVAWKEAAKRFVVRRCAAGLVAGSRHVTYLSTLGMDPAVVFTGYDVIDNGYFQTRVTQIRAQEQEVAKAMKLPKKYFLACSRFVAKKNLPFLIEAYAEYRKQSSGTPYDLLVLGDGSLKEKLVALTHQLAVSRSVHLPGFKQYNELPYYYAFASAFVHASTSEQWGLVVNEAMAAGLPVLVSEPCGCVPELVQNGVNGFSFDPFAVRPLASLMQTLAGNEALCGRMGARSKEIIARWHPDTFGSSLQQAARCAKNAPPKNTSFLDRMILKSLIFR